MKKILVALFALLSLNIFSANEDNVKKISVTGNAQREIMPDMATLSFQIKDKDKTLSAASSKVKQKLEKFKKDLRTKNLMSGDIETVSISDRKIKLTLKPNEVKVLYSNDKNMFDSFKKKN